MFPPGTSSHPKCSRPQFYCPGPLTQQSASLFVVLNPLLPGTLVGSTSSLLHTRGRLSLGLCFRRCLNCLVAPGQIHRDCCDLVGAGCVWKEWEFGGQGATLPTFPIHPQIQKPVVKTDMEQLAQELAGLAQSQVRKSRGPTGRAAVRWSWRQVGWEAGAGGCRGQKQGSEPPTVRAQTPEPPPLCLRVLPQLCLIQDLPPACWAALGESLSISGLLFCHL